VQLRSREVLAQYLDATGISERQIARAAGLSHSTVNHLVTGRRAGCSPATALAIEQALGCAPGTLFAPEPPGAAPVARRHPGRDPRRRPARLATGRPSRVILPLPGQQQVCR
jgi:transcriptional regulator with XRE-family HTH domain